jgi:hypothetical protein
LVSLAGELGCGLELSIYPRDFERLARANPKGLPKAPWRYRTPDVGRGKSAG